MGNELEDLKYAFEYIDTIICRFQDWKDNAVMKRALVHLKEAHKEISLPLAFQYIQSTRRPPCARVPMDEVAEE